MSEKITLSTPVDIDGTKVDTLSMREPSVADMLTAKKAKAAPEEVEIALFANLCEIPAESIKKMTLRDYTRLQEAFKRLTEDGAASPLD